MRRNLKKLSFLAFVVVVGALLFRAYLHKPLSKPNPVLESLTARSPEPPTPAESLSYRMQVPGGTFEPSDPRWQQWKEKEKADPNFQWKMPIAFYGKVIDEEGNPVEGVQLRIVGTDSSMSGNFHRTLVSDANGLVSLTGLQGKGFDAALSKPGYYSLRNNRTTFEYAAFWDPFFYQPDPTNPVLFRLRKKSEAEPLIHRQELRALSTDGRPAYFDLLSGKTSTGSATSADLAISVLRPTDPRRPYNWKVKVEATREGSGIIESREELLSLAPETGYQKLIEFTESAADPNWKSEATKRFYVRSRDGRLFARVEAIFMPKYQEGAAVRWQYYVNPSGSRNLEFDPAKAIKP